VWRRCGPRLLRHSNPARASASNDTSTPQAKNGMPCVVEPVGPVDAADFDTGGRHSAQKPPTVYTTDPEMELVPIPR
jgi:hypothetical protein